MRKVKKILLSGVGGALRGGAIPATSYYVDATGGSDANTGLSQAAPWQTLAKVNASTFLPGEQILFKKGETWKAQSLVMPSSGAAGNPITFGAYGTGANPLFDPTTEYNDWTLDSGAIWKRSDTSYLVQIFEDGARMIYQPDFASLVQGSWCKVAGTPGTAYVWCSDDGNPNTGHIVEYVADAQKKTIRMNGQSHLVFDGIDVTKSSVAAYNTDVAYNADLTGTVVADITIKNCTVSWSGIRGVLMGVSGEGTDCYPIDVTVENVVGHDDLDHSFWIGRGTRLNVIGCETYNSGADVAPEAKNYPITGTFTHYPDGILISGNALDCVVRGNYVYDIYGFAILDELSLGMKSSGTIIERNHIDQSSNAKVCVQICGVNTITRNNWIQTGTGNGVMLADAPTAPLIYNNTIISATGAAHSIDTNLQPGAKIKNNIVIRAGATNRYLSVALAAQTGFTANNNLYYGASTGLWFWGPTQYSSLATWQAASSKDANSLNVDPEFVTANTDLHLQSTSDCIAAGEAGLVTDDYDGVARGAAIDIGAYEYVA